MALQTIVAIKRGLLAVALAAGLGLLIATVPAQGQTDEDKVAPERVQACQRAANALVTNIRAKRLTMEVRDRLDSLVAALEVQCAVGRFSEAAQTADAIRTGLQKR